MKWDKYRKRKGKKGELWVLVLGLINGEMDCQFAESKLYTQAIVRLLSLAMPQFHVTLRSFGIGLSCVRRRTGV